MVKKIQLSIQEIVCDFEKIVRYHERLDVQFDFEKADDKEISRFNSEMVAMAEKYIPNYKKHVSEEYFKDYTPTFDRALELYGMLYENLKEIFYQLI